MTDPYKVLELSPGASDEEIKKAYKRLAKKYHPDVTGNDPRAAQKMQEINAAYDELINHKNSSSSYSSGGYSGSRSYGGGYGGGGFGGGGYGYGGTGSSYNYGNSQDQDYINKMRAATNFINAREYWQALNVLSSIPQNKRDGRWYYLSAVAKSGSGDNNGAKEDIYQALRFEPNNAQYQAFRDRLDNTNTSYNTYRENNYSKKGFAGTCCSLCLPCLIFNLICNFCC